MLCTEPPPSQRRRGSFPRHPCRWSRSIFTRRRASCSAPARSCAKGINFILTNGGAMSDYKGFGKAKKPMLPSIGVPTTAGTGSEAQSYALIADEKSHLKMACGDRKAAFATAILDPELTITQPL